MQTEAERQPVLSLEFSCRCLTPHVHVSSLGEAAGAQPAAAAVIGRFA